MHYDQLTCPAPLAENALMHSDTAICKYEQHIHVYCAQYNIGTALEDGGGIWDRGRWGRGRGGGQSVI